MIAPRAPSFTHEGDVEWFDDVGILQCTACGDVLQIFRGQQPYDDCSGPPLVVDRSRGLRLDS